MTIKVGDNGFWYDEASMKSSMIIFSIDSEPILWFNRQGDNFLLNLTLYDEKNKVILKVRDNEMVYTTTSWDITLIGKTLTIRSAARKIDLSLTVSPNENLISIEKATVYYNGHAVILDENGMHIAGSIGGLRNCRVKGSGHLINFGTSEGGAMNFVG
jgi:trigger factor